MIRLCNVSFGSDRNIFSGISYDFEPGIFYILQGENGVGKTTLARIVLGLLKPNSGEVKRPKGCIMSYLPDSNGIYPELTIRQNLRFRLGLYGADRCKSDAALALLEGFGLAEHAHERVAALSLGMQKKCAIVCACAIPADFLVLDEPLNALDREARAAFYELVPRLTSGGRTVLCISHSFERAAGRRIVLTRGALVDAS